MNGQTEAKLKALLGSVPPGFLVDSKWMTAMGIARQSIHDYVRRGWLESVMHGLYRRPVQTGGQDLSRDWRVAVISAQWLMNYQMHVGGMTALMLEGHQHYLKLGGPDRVYVYGEAPGWLLKLDVDATFVKLTNRLFGDSQEGVTHDDPAGAVSSNYYWSMKTSKPERAILEALDELPDNESFHQIDVTFQSLANLRPRLLTKLLRQCTSVKVKRLFFVMAEHHDFPWLKHVDREGIDLGHGDRSLVKGGKLHPTYRITVPAEFVREGVSDGA